MMWQEDSAGRTAGLVERGRSRLETACSGCSRICFVISSRSVYTEETLMRSLISSSDADLGERSRFWWVPAPANALAQCYRRLGSVSGVGESGAMCLGLRALNSFQLELQDHKLILILHCQTLFILQQ